MGHTIVYGIAAGVAAFSTSMASAVALGSLAALVSGSTISRGTARGFIALLLANRIPVTLASGTGGTRVVVDFVPFLLLGVNVLLLHRFTPWAVARVDAPRSRAGSAAVSVAIAYAFLCFSAAEWIKVRIPAPIVFGSSPLTAGSMTARAESPAAAIAFPLAIAMIVAVVTARNALRGPVAAAAFRALAVALCVAFAGLLVALVLDHSLRGAVVIGDRILGSRGSLVLGAPDFAVWTLAPAMGACDVARGTLIGTLHVMCYDSFPRGSGFVHAPTGYLLFLLAPATGTIAGGFMLARRFPDDSRIALAYKALGAGMLFAAMFGVAALLAAVQISGSIAGRTFAFAAGPDLLPSFLLALAWGVVGCSIGTVIGGSWLRRRAKESESSV